MSRDYDIEEVNEWRNSRADGSNGQDICCRYSSSATSENLMLEAFVHLFKDICCAFTEWPEDWAEIEITALIRKAALHELLVAS